MEANIIALAIHKEAFIMGLWRNKGRWSLCKVIIIRLDPYIFCGIHMIVWSSKPMIFLNDILLMECKGVDGSNP